MASQVVSAAKRYRVSLLIDTYGELLTEKQRTFLRHYYEQDLSFGEIAREYGVSRQAIFDSVRHGKDSLERFERALGLIEHGWTRLTAAGLTVDRLIERLDDFAAGLNDHREPGALERLGQDLRGLVRQLRSGGAPDEDDDIASAGERPH